MKPASQSQAASQQLLGDLGAWGGNVSAAVLIVFVNKLLMDPRHGYGFVFATCLCSFHFFTSAGAMRLWEGLGMSEKKVLPWKDTMFFSCVAATSVASLNLSLLLNSVGFYQVCKLLIIPFVCIMEAILYGRRYSFGVLCCIGLAVMGVGFVTVSDVSINPLGFIIAMISVISSGMQQILCGSVQRNLGVTSMQLLSNSGFQQAFMLLFVGVGLDKLVARQWVWEYDYTSASTSVLLLSCCIAIFVNVSQFMCLGRFSAVTFQVLGHTKTVLVLLVGWLLLHDQMPGRKLLGVAMAVVGMVGYGILNSKAPPPTPASKVADAKLEEATPLLDNVQVNTTATNLPATFVNTAAK